MSRWDAENRLIKIVYPGPPGTGNNTEFSYDGLGRNVKIVEKASYVVTETKQFVYSGKNRFEERSASGSLVKKFFAFGQENSGTSYFYLKNSQGSIIGMTNNGASTVSSRCYDSFGVSTILTESVTPDFGYGGYYFHSRSGLSQSFTRLYDPILGRWLSRDKLEETAGSNLYRYVANDPVNNVDPDGLQQPTEAPSSPTTPQTETIRDILFMVVIVGGIIIWASTRPQGLPADEKTGRPAEKPFSDCRYSTTRANCIKCCNNKHDEVAENCKKKYGPKSPGYDCKKFRCCDAWATRYFEVCLRRCNGSWGWNDETTPPENGCD